MKINKITFVFVIVQVLNGFSADFMMEDNTMKCGKDNSRISVVYEGLAKIETYPWMGYLIYPTKIKRYTTALVLVTRQVALGSATEIDKLPKVEFRARARAVFGHNCSGPTVPVRDYSYHPDYESNSYSALAMVQLETDYSTVYLQPICPPPTYIIIDHQFFAMALSNNSKKPVVKLYEMVFVKPDECKSYYRRSGLDVDSMWPTHTACARAVSGGECVWRSGAVLALRQGGKWYLLGFGVYGPGCGAPARFLDYGVYHTWVQRSVASIGQPAISRIADNVMVLRRSMSSLQRFGPCDFEETNFELYTDQTTVTTNGMAMRSVKYNVTLVAGMEYSCVVFSAQEYHSMEKPLLYLRRWCAGAAAMCKDFQHLEIQFYVEIMFRRTLNYTMKAYGREAKAMDVKRSLKFINERKEYPNVTYN